MSTFKNGDRVKVVSRHTGVFEGKTGKVYGVNNAHKFPVSVLLDGEVSPVPFTKDELKMVPPASSASQPPPETNAGRPIYEMVVDDIELRAAEGLKKYGTLLQAGNGRDALVDAYQEAIDLCLYLRQKIEETA